MRWVFMVAPKETQSAWRKAPSDHTLLLDLCALQYVRKVYKNNTVRVGGRVIDIPRRRGSGPATYAGRTVIVKHLLSGSYRVFCEGECIAWVEGKRPKSSSVRGARTQLGWAKRERRRKQRKQREQQDVDDEGVTFSLTS